MTDQTLYQTPFVSLIDRDGYIFLHESRSNGQIISVLPFRQQQGKREYLARVEICPAHGMEPERCSITGGVEAGENERQCAVNELNEEAGYIVSESDLIALGLIRPSKSSDTTAFLFAVDVTHLTAGDAPGDGTAWEHNASTEWLTLGDALTVQDPLFVTAVARLAGLLTTKDTP